MLMLCRAVPTGNTLCLVLIRYWNEYLDNEYSYETRNCYALVKKQSNDLVLSCHNIPDTRTWHDIMTLLCIVSSDISALTLLVGRQEGHSACKKLRGQVLAWLSVWSKVQTCIWPSWCHCHSLSIASVKSRLVLPFWYRLTQLVLDKGPLNRCVCVCVCVLLVLTSAMSEEDAKYLQMTFFENFCISSTIYLSNCITLCLKI